MKRIGLFVVSALLLTFSMGLWSVEEPHRMEGKKLDLPFTPYFNPSPFAKKMRVLIFTSYRSGSGRYAQELANRFDLDHGIVLVHAGKLIGGNSGATRLEDYLNTKWDAFVFLQDTPTGLLKKNYPKLYAMMLVQIVREGAGLVMADYDDPAVLKEKNLLPGFKARSVAPLKAKYYKIGKGLGVQLQGFDMPSPDYRKRYGYGRKTDAQVIPYSEDWRNEYDNRFRILGEQMLTVAGKIPEKITVSRKGRTLSLKGKFSPGSQLCLTVKGFGDTYKVYSGKAASGNYTLPELPPGKYFLTALVKKNGKAENFFGSTFTLKENKANCITGIDFKDYANDVGKTISGKVKSIGGGKIIMRLRDTQRRILMQKVLPADGSFSFKVESWMPSMMTLEASLMKGNKEVSRKYDYCNRIIRRWDMFEFSAWGHAYNHMGVHNLNYRLAEVGMTSLMMPGHHMKHSPWGMQPYPIHSAHVFDLIPGKNPRECFFSQARRDKLTKRFSYKNHFKVGMRIVSLGDEVQEHYGCMAPGCLKEYSNFLKRKYKGDLARLNKNWGTKYTSWDKVGLSNIPEKNNGKDLEKYMNLYAGDGFRVRWNHFLPHYVHWLKSHTDTSFVTKTWKVSPRARRFWQNVFIDQEAGSFLAGNYARWIDRQDFKSYAYSQTNKYLRDYFRKIDPYTLAGMEGTGGVDLLSHGDRMVETQGWMGNYAESNNNNLMNEVSRSITPNNYISNSWVGYTPSPTMLCSRIWNELFRRPTMIMFYTTTGDGMPAYQGILRADLSTFPAAGEMLRQTKKFRDGLGNSLIRSKAYNDPIAILYSYPSSVFGARVRHGASYDYARFSHNGAIYMVLNLGYTFRYVTNTRLADGRDSLKDFKVLILPRSCALSDELLEKIEEFVREGGKVIADVRTGIMDEHLNVRNSKIWEKIAGIKRKSISPAESQILVPVFTPGVKSQLEPGVALGTGTARASSANGIPGWIINKYGKGMVLTLNFPFQDLKGVANLPANYRGLLEEILGSAGKVPVITDAGKKIYNVRRGEWQNGDMRILAFKGAPGAEKTWQVTLPKAQYVYSIDREKDLGKVKTISMPIHPPKPEFFVLTSKPLPPVTVKVPARVKKGSTFAVTFQVKGMKGERPVKIAFERDGKKIDLQTIRESSCKGVGPVKEFFRTALNEKEGKYTIRFTDVYTGKTSIHPITIVK